MSSAVTVPSSLPVSTSVPAGSAATKAAVPALEKSVTNCPVASDQTWTTPFGATTTPACLCLRSRGRREQQRRVESRGAAHWSEHPRLERAVFASSDDRGAIRREEGPPDAAWDRRAVDCARSGRTRRRGGGGTPSSCPVVSSRRLSGLKRKLRVPPSCGARPTSWALSNRRPTTSTARGATPACGTTRATPVLRRSAGCRSRSAAGRVRWCSC